MSSRGPERPTPPKPAPPSFRQGVLAHSWSAFHPLPALYCAPGVVLALLAGAAAGQPGLAVLGAAGAFSAGFGAFQRLTRFHIAPMLLAAICMGVSMAVGTVAGANPWVDAAVVAVASFSLGLAASFGTGPWWVLLQGGIFLVIAGAQPGDWVEGAFRGLIVFAGGAGQIALVALLRRLAPAGFPPIFAPNAVHTPPTGAAWLGEARRVISPRAPEFRYAVVLGLATGSAILIAHSLRLAHGYWAALTVLLVLRRGGSETLIRGAQRIGGTMLGAAAATLLVALLRPDPPMLIALIGGVAWAGYATQWVNYGIFSVSVTSYVAFLLAMLGLPEAQIAWQRVIATLMGGAIGVAALGLAGLGRGAGKAAFRLLAQGER